MAFPAPRAAFRGSKFAWLAPLLLVACDGTSGPCVVYVEDPLFRVVAVLNQETGEEIQPPVSLFNFQIDGMDVTRVEDAIIRANQRQNLIVTENVSAVGDTLKCTWPCAFATSSGEYRFDAVAPGFQPKAVSIVGESAGSEGGCPTRLFGGTKEFSLELIPEG